MVDKVCYGYGGDVHVRIPCRAGTSATTHLTIFPNPSPPTNTQPQDRTILAVAIPALTNTFHSITDIGWYGSSYMLTAACFNPIFGRIYALYSTKTCFLTSILIFEVGSAVCGAARSSVAFIIGRAVAGLGSAGIFQGGMMILVGTVPLAKRPMFTAVFGMAFGVSGVLGPVVGGAFTDHL